MTKNKSISLVINRSVSYTCIHPRLLEPIVPLQPSSLSQPILIEHSPCHVSSPYQSDTCRLRIVVNNVVDSNETGASVNVSLDNEPQQWASCGVGLCLPWQGRRWCHRSWAT